MSAGSPVRRSKPCAPSRKSSCGGTSTPSSRTTFGRAIAASMRVCLYTSCGDVGVAGSPVAASISMPLGNCVYRRPLRTTVGPPTSPPSAIPCTGACGISEPIPVFCVTSVCGAMARAIWPSPACGTPAAATASSATVRCGACCALVRSSRIRLRRDISDKTRNCGAEPDGICISCTSCCSERFFSLSCTSRMFMPHLYAMAL